MGVLMHQHQRTPMKRIKLEKWIKMEVMIRVDRTRLDQKNQWIRNTLLPRSSIPQIKIIQPPLYVYCLFQIESAQAKLRHQKGQTNENGKVQHQTHDLNHQKYQIVVPLIWLSTRGA